MERLPYLLTVVLTILLLMFFNTISQAQTSFNISNKTTGDTLITISNNGRIGIGTTNPIVTIDVKSDVVEHATSLCLGNSDDSHWLQLYSGRGGTSPLSPLMLWQEGDPMRFASWGATYNEYMRLSAEGNLGIGTTTPTTKLEVADTIYSSLGGFKFPDGSIQATAAGAGSGNTLDQAYDQGGAGAGRTITADAGAFEVGGVDGALFTGTYESGTLPATGAGARMMWYPAKAAFRAGRIDNTQWNDTNIGIYSIAMGNNTMASAGYSTALGWNTIASGFASTALGRSTTASGYNATAMGINTIASGNYSTTFGVQTTASGQYSIAMGQEIEARGTNTVAIALSDQNGLQVTQDSTMAIMGGYVGIGTVSPATSLEVADTIYSSVGGFKFPDQTVQATAAGVGSSNTLDQAYDEGGVGLGRTITADAGAFEVSGVDGALFTGTYNNGVIPVEGAGVRMMWYPHKAAFRAGYVNGNLWDDVYIGNYSIGLGFNARATGSNSTAFGYITAATGNYSTAIGYASEASGWSSTAMGYSTLASANAATALGNDTRATGEISTALGQGIEASGSHTVAIALSDQSGVNVSQDSTMAIMGGYVGIGTSIPSTGLEVADTIYSSVGGFKFPDQTIQTTAATGGGGASSINDLTDGKTGGNSTFLGENAGYNDDGSNNNNTGLGRSALALTTTGSYNTAVGTSVMNLNSEGSSNTALGYYALFSNTTGDGNVGIGLGANRNNQEGSDNTIVGYNAGGGSAAHSKSGNVFIGYTAGRYESGDNKLYIENSSSDEPLIGGDFATDEIYLNGNVGIEDVNPLSKLHVTDQDISLPNTALLNEIITIEDLDAGLGLYSNDDGNYGSVISLGEITSGTFNNKWSLYRTTSTANPANQLRFSFGQNADYTQNARLMALDENGNVGIGTTTPTSKLDVRGNVTVRDESSGDIVIELGTGLDYAEGFDVSDKRDIEPGTVLCIDENNPGNLKMSEQSYDYKVAGIVAGANALGSGVTLGSDQHDFNVALAGRVYCNVDARGEAVKAGDLLTTSDVPGFAQKVTDYQKSQGAILGKAMQNLEKGEKGQILVLVTLQ